MIRVSIVEDKEDIRRGLANAIERAAGMSCLSQYANGEDAISGLPAECPDLVLMDIGLPKMDGIECLLRVKERTPRIEFLMFTVFDEDDKVFEALKAGAVGYILKSERAQGALRAIEEWQAGGAPMSRAIARKVLQSFNQQTPQEDPDFESLTPRQFKILELLSTGMLNKEIADRLGISENTVKQHNYAIFKKLHVNNRMEAVNKYLKRGSTTA